MLKYILKDKIGKGEKGWYVVSTIISRVWTLKNGPDKPIYKAFVLYRQR